MDVAEIRNDGLTCFNYWPVNSLDLWGFGWEAVPVNCTSLK